MAIGIKSGIPSYATPLWSSRLAQEIDRITSEKYKIDGSLLMELAGKAVAEEALRLGATNRPTVVLVGTGNNGGDGLVAARHIYEAGAQVAVFVVPRNSIGGLNEISSSSALFSKQMEIAKALELRVDLYRRGCLHEFSRPLIIDAVLGIGFRGPMDSAMMQAALTEAAQIKDKLVISVDMPSGLDGDGTSTDAPLLAADFTVTFGARKPVHVVAPGKSSCGEVILRPVGFPRRATADGIQKCGVDLFHADVTSLLELDPWRGLSAHAHKYDRGHVLVIGGSSGKAGAPIMAALAALRAGAGWASVAMASDVKVTVAGEFAPELTFEDLFDGPSVSATKLATFLQDRRVKAVVIGPGMMGRKYDEQVVDVLENHAANADASIVVDAGALHDFALLRHSRKLTATRWLLTPHPGEWKKMGRPDLPSPIGREGIEAAKKFATELGVTVVYKSATPVVIDGQDGYAAVTDCGTKVLARAGSGDVLAGVAGAHGAIGFSATLAALRSQMVVARAALLAAVDVGDDAVLASDIMTHLGHANN